MWLFDSSIALFSHSFYAVAMFADIADFTNLCENLSLKYGASGVNELWFYLNRYMESLVRFIGKSGGDVIKVCDVMPSRFVAHDMCVHAC